MKIPIFAFFAMCIVSAAASGQSHPDDRPAYAQAATPFIGIDDTALAGSARRAS
jgi:hypothetical protein